MQTQISGSIRLISKTEKLKVYLNFRSEHIDKLNIAGNRWAEITCRENLYRIRFLPKNNGRCRFVSLNVSSGSAALSFPPSVFKISDPQVIIAAKLDVDYIPDGMTFVFDREWFIAPKVRHISQIATREEKEECGFDPETSWGEKAAWLVDSTALDSIREYIKVANKAKCEIKL